MKPPSRLVRRIGLAGLGATAAYTAFLWTWRLGWVPELAHEARWQAGSFALATGIVLAFARSWRGAFAALALGLVHAGPALRLSFGRDEDPGRGATLTVAEANLWHSNKDADAVRAWLEADRPDVVACFEVSTFWARELERLSDLYPYRRIVRSFDLDPDDAARRGTVEDKVLERESKFPARWGAALLSKRPLEDVVVRTVPGSPDPYMEAVVTVDGTRFHLVALHPERPGRSPRTARRDALLAHVAGTTTWTPTSIVVGDLNATRYAPAYREFVDVAGLRDAARGFGRMPTWSWFPTSRWKWLDLDHVLVREGIAVLDCRVGPPIGSDHRPLVARLRARSSP